ncbi:MAG: hypothetical protein ACI4NA_06115 [Succinivibrio sp.]
MALAASWAAQASADGDDNSGVRAAFFPPVPETWSMSIDGKTVVYSSPVPKGSKVPATEVRITYTKDTGGRDAAAYADDYIRLNHCAPKSGHGKGFYTTNCQTAGKDAVIIGESDNLYLIELKGVYNQVSTDLINQYVNAVISGKRTFRDRDIGEMVEDSKPSYAPPETSDMADKQQEAAPAAAPAQEGAAGGKKDGEQEESD